jgi:hypothetical protein
MFRWIAIALSVSLILALVIWERQKPKVSYVNGLPAYNHLPGREYVVQENCYIFRFTDRDTSYPLIGSHATVPALPPEVSAELVGRTFGNVRLLDTIPVGDRFRIVSVRREETRRRTLITFEILLQNDAERRYPRLDAEFILDHTPTHEGRAPEILPRYAAARVKG